MEKAAWQALPPRRRGRRCDQDAGADGSVAAKKMKIEESDVREQCRINCRADIVIQHVLPYLLLSPADADESGATDESSSGSEGETDEAHNFMY